MKPPRAGRVPDLLKLQALKLRFYGSNSNIVEATDNIKLGWFTFILGRKVFIKSLDILQQLAYACTYTPNLIILYRMWRHEHREAQSNMTRKDSGIELSGGNPRRAHSRPDSNR